MEVQAVSVWPAPSHLHAKVRDDMKWPKDFVLHSLRHSFLTRLGKAGVDAFTIMKIAGHSTITISQKYVHLSNEATERAFEKLAAAEKSSCLSGARGGT